MTATFSSQAVPHSRPDEFLRELDLNVDIVFDNIVRLAMVTEEGYESDLNPNISRHSRDNDALHPSIKARWLQGGYVARGQMYPFSALCGLVADLVNPCARVKKNLDLWATRNRQTSEREQELIRLLRAGIEKHRNADGTCLLEIRTGRLTGEDPGWRAHEDIAAVAQAQVCITCIQPIRFSNAQWRHEDTGRAEVYDESPCPACNGSRAVASRRFKGEYDRCQACLTTPGVKLTLSHLADPEHEGRKV